MISTINAYRSAIEEIDLEIIALIDKRTRYAREAIKLKSEMNEPVRTISQENKVIERYNKGLLRFLFGKELAETILKMSRGSLISND